MTTEENRENKVWEGKGLLWLNLAIYETTEGMVGVMSNSLSFMGDKEIEFPEEMLFTDMIRKIESVDFDYYSELTLYADEG